MIQWVYMEKEIPKSTYEKSVDFYHRQIAECRECMSNLQENDMWGSLNVLENLEMAQLKLLQIERRHESGISPFE